MELTIVNKVSFIFENKHSGHLLQSHVLQRPDVWTILFKIFQLVATISRLLKDARKGEKKHPTTTNCYNYLKRAQWIPSSFKDWVWSLYIPIIWHSALVALVETKEYSWSWQQTWRCGKSRIRALWSGQRAGLRPQSAQAGSSPSPPPRGMWWSHCFTWESHTLNVPTSNSFFLGFLSHLVFLFAGYFLSFPFAVIRSWVLLLP